MDVRSRLWIEELESALFNGHNAALLIHSLPPFYEVLDTPDRLARTQRLQQRAIQLLIKDKLFRPALEALHAVDRSVNQSRRPSAMRAWAIFAAQRNVI